MEKLKLKFQNSTVIEVWHLENKIDDDTDNIFDSDHEC